jgi:histidine phosphotransferase ChpT
MGADLTMTNLASDLEPVGAAELAAHLAARLCHDVISPASAIVSGLDLLEDPSAQDMRAEAMELVSSSARKLVEMLAFIRVAYGASATAELFDARELEGLTRGLFSHVRPDLEWAVTLPQLPKPAARVLLNLAMIAIGVLPSGGLARLGVQQLGTSIVISLEATGQRVRMRPEVLSGLRGEPKGQSVGGHWVQAYYLQALLKDAGGLMELVEGEGRVAILARLPSQA